MFQRDYLSVCATGCEKGLFVGMRNGLRNGVYLSVYVIGRSMGLNRGNKWGIERSRRWSKMYTEITFGQRICYARTMNLSRSDKEIVALGLSFMVIRSNRDSIGMFRL